MGFIIITIRYPPPSFPSTKGCPESVSLPPTSRLTLTRHLKFLITSFIRSFSWNFWPTLKNQKIKRQFKFRKSRYFGLVSENIFSEIFRAVYFVLFLFKILLFVQNLLSEILSWPCLYIYEP